MAIINFWRPSGHYPALELKAEAEIASSGLVSAGSAYLRAILCYEEVR